MKRFAAIIAAIVCVLAVEARTYTTVFINNGLAAPLTVKTANGTYKVSSSSTLNGNIEPTHVTDGNGNWVVIGGRSYNEDGDEATITYKFSTLYNNSSSTSSSKSSVNSSNKRNRLSKEERRERAAERRAAAINANVFSFEQEVDLGLPSGTIWAGYNLGASSPLEPGNYYTWGATWPGGRFDEDDYWDHNYLAYSHDGNTILRPAHDAALQEWGEGWQIPNYDDISELLECCEWECGKFQGVNGYRATGPNGVHIFFPIFGIYGEGQFTEGYSAYWTNELGDDDDASAIALCVVDMDGATNHFGTPITRYYGCYIRPVLKE